MARPSTLTAERCEAIEAAHAAGAPLSVAASAGGVSARTVSRWIEDGHVVRRRLAAVPAPRGKDELPDTETIERALLGSILRAAEAGDWRAAAWVAERRWPKKYGRR